MRFEIKFTVVLMLSAILFSLSAVHASNLTESKAELQIRWKSGTIPIAYSNSLIKPNLTIKADSDVFGALRRSLQTWEKAANIRFDLNRSDKQSVSPKGNFGDGISLITIAQTPENLLLFGSDSDQVAAKTRIFFNKKGYITEADIVLNPYQQFSTDGTFGTFDLETTLTHEIGHLLGLEHSPVFGAAMHDHRGRNGVFNLPSADGRTLGLSDVSAVRSFYGAAEGHEECCGKIAGKIELKNVKSAKKSIVWAEESENGRVAAESSLLEDGSFSLEGLTPGRYRIFCQSNTAAASAVIADEIGIADVRENKIAVLDKTVEVGSVSSNLQFLGFNGQLTEISVPVNAGKSFTVYLGGKNLDPAKIKIGFNSANLEVVRGSLVSQDFGSEISAVSFTINIAKNALPGDYSLYVQTGNGKKEFIIGAVSVENYNNPWNSYALPEE